MVGYVASFLLIGMYWLQHYAIFHFLKCANRTLVVLNGLFLLSISFLPFPTGLLAVYRHDELAVVLFGTAHVLCGLSLASLWLYAERPWLPTSMVCHSAQCAPHARKSLDCVN
jgi:uncharacterized membrane protein